MLPTGRTFFKMSGSGNDFIMVEATLPAGFRVARPLVTELNALNIHPSSTLTTVYDTGPPIRRTISVRAPPFTKPKPAARPAKGVTPAMAAVMKRNKAY